mgnify:CR=1 FL=1
MFQGFYTGTFFIGGLRSLLEVTDRPTKDKDIKNIREQKPKKKKIQVCLMKKHDRFSTSAPFLNQKDRTYRQKHNLKLE